MIEIEAFVDREQITPAYFEKPYVLVPGKKAEKGYVLLREVLKKTGKVGIGRVVIRTKEYLCDGAAAGRRAGADAAALPGRGRRRSRSTSIPEGDAAKWKVTPKEMEMATTLLESMASDFKPDDYKDEFRERLTAVIKKRLKQKGATTTVEEEAAAPEATTNVVDFMSLLKKSLEKKGETPTKATARKASKKPATKKAPAKSTTTKSKKSA